MDTESGRSVDLVFYSPQGQQGHQLKMKGLRRKEWNVIVIGGWGAGGKKSKCVRETQQGCQAVQLTISGFCDSFKVKPSNANYVFFCLAA